MEVFWVVVVVGVGIAIFFGIQKAKELEAAKQACLQSIAELKQAPTNANLKQRTLALGRVYSNLTRDKKGNTVFDEVALMNDINAACAAASAGGSSLPRESIESRLQTLMTLKAKGLVDAAEYDRRRAEILASI